MKKLICILAFPISQMTFAESLVGGWYALTEQSDPFDTNKKRIVHISKQGFTVRCNDISFSAPSYGYESLSFKASIQYLVDGGEPRKRKGKYSTYLGGSDLLTDSRYFSFGLDEETVNSMKAGLEMKMAGTRGSGWTTKTLDLSGFTNAYNRMCGSNYAAKKLRPSTIASRTAAAVNSEMVSASDFAKSYEEGLSEIRFRGYRDEKNGAKLSFVYECSKVKNVVGNAAISLFGYSLRGDLTQTGCELDFDLSRGSKSLLQELRSLPSDSGMDHYINAQVPTEEVSIK